MADGCLCNFRPPTQFIFLMGDAFIKDKLNALYYLSALRDSKTHTPTPQPMLKLQVRPE
jgi:hypothetical protein